jgi:hypothetical protein
MFLDGVLLLAVVVVVTQFLVESIVLNNKEVIAGFA